MSSPKRAFEIEIKVGGDTLEDAKHLIEEWLYDLTPTSGIVTGGPSAGGFVKVTHNPEMTHERYVQDLNRHLETEVEA